MTLSEYKSYDDLPLFLNAAMVAKVLGVSPSSSYELMHEPDFPVLKVGNNLYTILPTQRAVDTFHQQQLDQLKLEATRRRVYQRQEYFARDRPHAASKP